MRRNKNGFTLTNPVGQGFTLIEILIASALSVIVAVGFLGLQYILSKNQISAWANYLSIEDANRAASDITRELRTAIQSENGSYPLVTANNQEIIFYSDYNYDGVTERIRYTLTGTQLIRGVIVPSGDPPAYVTANEKTKTISNIVRNSTDPLFYYYNSDWPVDITNNPLVQTDRISKTRYIKLILITNSNPNAPEFNYQIETDVKLRMLNSS